VTRNYRLRIGSLILSLAAIGLLPASWFIAEGASLSDRTGRHLVAGALANLSVAVLMTLIALVAIRRGERWGIWAYCCPIIAYGVPVLVIDATHVAAGNLLLTVGPQLIGLLLAATGFAIVGPPILSPPRDAAG